MDTLPYFALLTLAAIPALAYQSGHTNLNWRVFFALCLIFVGLRYQVGSDWEGYLAIAENVYREPFSKVFENAEFLYYVFVWLSVDLGLGIYGANVVTSYIFLVGVFRFCGSLPNRWLALLTSLPFLVIVVGMSANRQAAAIGLSLVLLADWQQSNLTKKMLIIMVAMLFHSSAAVLVMLFVVDSSLSKSRRWLLAALLAVLTSYFLVDLSSVQRYESSYVQHREEFHADGAILQILVNALPAVLAIIFRGRYQKILPNFRVIYWMAILSIALVPIGLAYSVIASRISFYLFPVSIALTSMAPILFSDEKSQNIALLAAAGAAFITLSLWLTFANHAYNHKPYQNIIFISSSVLDAK